VASSDNATVREVDVEQMSQALADGGALIDVREPMEYAAGHVPGAVPMPMTQLPSRLGELDKRAPVYVICASGNRSAAMTDFLNRAGFEAYSVAGGTAAWAGAGRPLDTGAAGVA
jgi:rhodanese-related sulfurtransferase